MAQRSLRKRLWYKFLHMLCRLGAVLFFRARVSGQEFIPATGGALVLSNHQSHLDPVLVGMACHRRLNYLARQTLFDIAPLRWLIRSLDAIPIDRAGTGLGGLKETLKRLKHEEMVLIFPEGTRTRDGELARFKPGFVALARRANVPLLPVGLDGAYQAWPRSRKLPRRGVVRIVFGPPLLPAEMAQLNDDELVRELEQRTLACFLQARQGRAAAVGRASQKNCS